MHVGHGLAQVERRQSSAGRFGDETLAGVSRIANVAAILVPESLLGKLMAIPMQTVETSGRSH